MINPIDGCVTVTSTSPRASRIFLQDAGLDESNEMEEMNGLVKWRDLFKNISTLPVPKATGKLLPETYCTGSNVLSNL